MTDGTNETVEVPKGPSIVEKREAEIRAKREELAGLVASNEASSQKALDAIKLERLDAEERRLNAELEYQRRLRGVEPVQDASTSEVPASSTPPAPDVPEVPASPVPPAPDASTPSAIDNKTTEASAKVTGKGK